MAMRNIAGLAFEQTFATGTIFFFVLAVHLKNQSDKVKLLYRFDQLY